MLSFQSATAPKQSVRKLKLTPYRSLFENKRVARFVNFEQAARRKLKQLHAAADLAFLRVPPQNRLEALKGGRKGQWSIRINEQWRLCFEWRDGSALNVEIVDYH